MTIHQALGDVAKLLAPIPTYLSARARDDLTSGETYVVASRSGMDDGAYGVFLAVSDEGLSDNDGTVLLTATEGVALKRQYDGAKRIEWFGGRADYLNPTQRGTDNLPALEKAVMADAVPGSAAFELSGGKVCFGLGEYYFSDTFENKVKVHLEGAVPVMAGSNSGTILNFAEGKTGIINHRHNTFGDETVVTTTTADGSKFTQFRLRSLGGASSGDTPLGGSGIALRGKAHIEAVSIAGFPLDGIHINATAGGGGHTEGNANLFALDYVQCTSNGRDGVHIRGADANAGQGQVVECTGNGRWGIYDGSFLGNKWDACHTAANGVSTPTFPSTALVHYEGSRYATNPNATEQQYVDTIPGTNDEVWQLIGTGGQHATIPTWAAGSPVGTYTEGGSYRTDNPNARTNFDSCYSESGQPPAWVDFPSMVSGGFSSAGNFGTGHVNDGRNMTGKTKHKNAPNSVHSLELVTTDTVFGRINIDGDYFTNLASWNPSFKALELFKYRDIWTNMRVVSGDPDQVYTFGRDIKPQAGSILLGPSVFLGNGNSARMVGFSTLEPTSGTYGRGDILFNLLPHESNILGWRCTTPGTGGDVEWEAVFNGEELTIVDAEDAPKMGQEIADKVELVAPIASTDLFTEVRIRNSDATAAPYAGTPRHYKVRLTEVWDGSAYVRKWVEV